MDDVEGDPPSIRDWYPPRSGRPSADLMNMDARLINVAGVLAKKETSGARRKFRHISEGSRGCRRVEPEQGDAHKH